MADQNWFDPSAYMDMFKTADMTKFFDPTKLPQVDAQALAEAQNKNMQAFIEANRAAAEGYRAVFTKQMEIAKETFANMQDSMKGLSAEPMGADGMQSRVDAARTAFEKANEDFKGLVDAARAANEEAFGILQARFQESIAEFQAISEKVVQQASEAA